MASAGFVDAGSATTAPVVMGDVCFDLLKEAAKNRHGNCNLYSLLSTLEDLAKPLGLVHRVTLGQSEVVYQTTIKLDTSLSPIVSQVLKRIFEESTRAKPDVRVSTESIKIIVPLIA
jgi:hypothetical protein